MDISTIYSVLYPDIKSQNCIRRIVITMGRKFVLQNEHYILSYCGTHMSENITKLQEKMRSWISVSAFLVNSVVCSSCFQICTVACTLAIAMQRVLLSCKNAATFVPISCITLKFNALKKSKPRKRFSCERYEVQNSDDWKMWKLGSNLWDSLL